MTALRINCQEFVRILPTRCRDQINTMKYEIAELLDHPPQNTPTLVAEMNHHRRHEIANMRSKRASLVHGRSTAIPSVGPLGTIYLLLALCAGKHTFAQQRETHSSQPAINRQLRLPDQPFDYGKVDAPASLKKQLQPLDNTPADNPITHQGATLGRVLFYDTKLSANGTTSCASCHLQAAGFAEPKPTSVGFEGKPVARNSMALINLRFFASGKMFWDQRANSLEKQVLMPIEDPIEMGHHLPTLIRQLAQDPLYPPLFQNAFGDKRITSDRIAKALAQFVRSMTSFGSRYDHGLEQTGDPRKPFPNFTDQENLGKEQFFGRALCAHCHLPKHDDPQSPQWLIFQLQTASNNGIDSSDAPNTDPGVATTTGKPTDQGKFKASSLRNLKQTAPYMHDGRFHTIDQVIEHYNWSVRPHPNLDPLLEDFAANGLALPEVPKVALAAFLETLSDEEFLADPRFSDPFVRSPNE